MLYELSMTTDYVGHWEEWQAVRELLQNAIDFGKPEISQPHDGIIIKSRGVTLSPRSLLLGYSDKRDDDSKIGQFGEGYKLACLVLCRLGYTVIIHNGPKIWMPSIEYSKKYDCKILVIDEKDNPNQDCEDLTFYVNCIIDLNKKYLPTVKPNSVLMHRPGQMFVSGLYICTVENFEHGYNFSPERVQLGRDRQMLSTFDVSYEAGRIWSDTTSTEKIYEMMVKDVADVQYFATHRQSISKAVAQEFYTRHGDTVPCSTQEEIEECAGRSYRLVPNALKTLLRRFKSYIMHFIGSPTERLEKWIDRWGHRIPDDARIELESIMKQMGKKDEKENETNEE